MLHHLSRLPVSPTPRPLLTTRVYYWLDAVCIMKATCIQTGPLWNFPSTTSEQKFSACPQQHYEKHNATPSRLMSLDNKDKGSSSVCRVITDDSLPYYSQISAYYLLARDDTGIKGTATHVCSLVF